MLMRKGGQAGDGRKIPRDFMCYALGGLQFVYSIAGGIT